MTDPTITCPNCKTEIKLNESLAVPLLEATRKQFEQQKPQRELESKRSRLRRELFTRQNGVELQHNSLINELKIQLHQQLRENVLFAVK